MDNKYTKYSVEDFAQDVNFINWVKKGANQKEWEDFVSQNPDLLKDLNTARKIVAALNFKIKAQQDDYAYEVYQKH